MVEPRYCRSHDLATIRVTGRDARQFLHAQTTQDLVDLPPDATRLAAWLTPKGRVRALFDVVPDGHAFWLVTAADGADWLAAELGRYVLRADATLEPATGRAVYSLLGDTDAWLRAHRIAIPRHGVARADDSLWFRTAPERIDVIAAPDVIEPVFADLAIANPDAAALAAIAAGRPVVSVAERDQYVAQMLNLDRLDAISFTKGCYPGQEIVARAHNLGEVKRRLARFRLPSGARPEARAAIVDAQTQAVGEINRVAATDSGYELLAVVRTDAIGHCLMLESDGRELEPLPLQNRGPEPGSDTGV